MSKKSNFHPCLLTGYEISTLTDKKNIEENIMECNKK